MDTDAFDCKFLFQEYFMKLPVVNRSFFLFFFCFFPLFLSPVASEETITQLTVATSKIKLNRVVVCTRFVGIRKSQNGSDTSELQSFHILYLQAHQNKLKYINYGVMCELHKKKWQRTMKITERWNQWGRIFVPRPLPLSFFVKHHKRHKFHWRATHNRNGRDE